ncbi:hypothetical protein DEO72_LG8g1030 [Vigna unguiculata]|uniref:Uncharacterized protein n=1 Tax=Vigna unguiculata TaxID=3917 RepID=A0A4D6MNS0_VIGUN|nr:hypothetical protein DEO72_LG8g1030 [Vigna unguiculata]
MVVAGKLAVVAAAWLTNSRWWLRRFCVSFTVRWCKRLKMVERRGAEKMEMQWGSRRCWFVKAAMVVAGPNGDGGRKVGKDGGCHGDGRRGEN